jgi:hypothetical protein
MMSLDEVDSTNMTNESKKENERTKEKKGEVTLE